MNNSLSKMRGSWRCLFGRTDVSRSRSTLTDNHCIEENLSAAKPFSEIPSATGFQRLIDIAKLPFIISSGMINESLRQKFSKYGPIFREQILNFSLVHTCDVHAIEKIHRTGSKYPRRIVVEPWRRYRDLNNQSRGILTEDGLKWKRMRVQLDKYMMKPKCVAAYDDQFNEVVTDFIEHIKRIKNLPENNGVVPRLDEELFRWSLETVVTVLYEIRMRLHSKEHFSSVSSFIRAVQDVFATTVLLIYLPPQLEGVLFRKTFKLHMDSWKIVFDTTKRLIDDKFAEIRQKTDAGEEVSGFLATLFASDMSMSEVYANISELMFGAVDTTSNTIQWVLYELSRSPEVQEQLYQQVTSVVPRGQIPSYNDLQNMPLLKAVVKEVLRLYPITNVSSRIPEEDVVLCGYRVPAGSVVVGSSYTVARDAAHYTNPDSFQPERWLRKSETDTVHNFAWLPFGFGPRGCIGRRVAELEMHLLLARLSQHFSLEQVNPGQVKGIVRGLLVPEKPIVVRLVDRS